AALSRQNRPFVVFHGWSPNGLRLSGARRLPPSDDASPRTVCSGRAARVRCSRGLGSTVLLSFFIACLPSSRDGRCPLKPSKRTEGRVTPPSLLRQRRKLSHRPTWRTARSQ